MSHSYTKSELKEYFFSALEMFNERLDSDISEENLLIDFFNPKNGIAVYENFCRERFPQYLDEQYKEDGYFESIGAQAFVSDTCYGVLIREDVDFTLSEILQMFLHEISHLYCTRNEIPGGHFFDKYCMGSGIEDGMINAGYAIWREAIADIMADSILREFPTLTLAMAKEEILNLNREIVFSNPCSKKAMSLVIVYVMISREASTIDDWPTAEKKIRKAIGFEEPLMYGILELVFAKLHTSPFWEITPDFVTKLGQMYLELLSLRAMCNKYGKSQFI